MLTVIEAAKKTDLTLISTVKAEMEITDRSSDPQLRQYIRQASDAISRYCNRTFALETVQESIRVPCGNTGLMLSRYPIVEIISITSGAADIAADGYELNSETGIIDRLLSDRPISWSQGKTVVTYRTGYVLPGGLPDGVERACVILVKAYASAGDRDPLVRSEAIEGAGATEFFSGAGTGLPPEVQGLLEGHIKPNG